LSDSPFGDGRGARHSIAWSVRLSKDIWSHILSWIDEILGILCG